MSPDLNHVFLTRFNLPSEGAESLIRAQDGWLRGRVELFEQYCLPSLRAQSNWDFRWIIYFDPESPRWLMDWIDFHRAERLFTPHFRSSVSHEELTADIRALVYTPRHGLLTTNVDNDDAIAVDFVDRVQSVGVPEERTAIYFTHGLIRSGHGVYSRTDRTNAFCSVIETWDEPRTCWSDWHNRLGQTMAVRQLGGAPAWLQVVHATNVSNRLHGLLISPARHRKLFPDLLDDIGEPGHLAIIEDRLVNLPVRVLRDSARALAKRAVLAAGGKDGLTRAKAVLASHGRVRRRVDASARADAANRETT